MRGLLGCGDGHDPIVVPNASHLQGTALNRVTAKPAGGIALDRARFDRQHPHSDTPQVHRPKAVLQGQGHGTPPGALANKAAGEQADCQLGARLLFIQRMQSHLAHGLTIAFNHASKGLML